MKNFLIYELHVISNRTLRKLFLVFFSESKPAHDEIAQSGRVGGEEIIGGQIAENFQIDFFGVVLQKIEMFLIYFWIW